MRAFVVASIILSIVIPALHVPALAAPHHAVRLAPADEYFGRQKMSILEIGNRLRDLNIRCAYHDRNVPDMLHSASMAEDAMRDWHAKYPADPWLRKDRLALAHIYTLLRR
ncbi:MAG TPA: hypothetical protein VGZ02_10430 [Candidatus Baltobacteraceae bacterium]|nr:hypothetical protein [Candidatus Baltobacteraceae bacterium]